MKKRKPPTIIWAVRLEVALALIRGQDVLLRGGVSEPDIKLIPADKIHVIEEGQMSFEDFEKGFGKFRKESHG